MRFPTRLLHLLISSLFRSYIGCHFKETKSHRRLPGLLSLDGFQSLLTGATLKFYSLGLDCLLSLCNPFKYYESYTTYLIKEAFRLDPVLITWALFFYMFCVFSNRNIPQLLRDNQGQAIACMCWELRWPTTQIEISCNWDWYFC